MLLSSTLPVALINVRCGQLESILSVTLFVDRPMNVDEGRPAACCCSHPPAESWAHASSTVAWSVGVFVRGKGLYCLSNIESLIQAMMHLTSMACVGPNRKAPHP